MTIFFLAGNGDGTFQGPILSIANLTGTLAAADLNDDGKLDLVLEIGGVAVQTYLGNGDGTFSNANNYLLIQISGNPPPSNGGVAIADFNLDGKPDVAVDGELLLPYRFCLCQSGPSLRVCTSAFKVGFLSPYDYVTESGRRYSG